MSTKEESFKCTGTLHTTTKSNPGKDNCCLPSSSPAYDPPRSGVRGPRLLASHPSAQQPPPPEDQEKGVQEQTPTTPSGKPWSVEFGQTGARAPDTRWPLQWVGKQHSFYPPTCASKHCPQPLPQSGLGVPSCPASGTQCFNLTIQNDSK